MWRTGCNIRKGILLFMLFWLRKKTENECVSSEKDESTVKSFAHRWKILGTLNHSSASSRHFVVFNLDSSDPVQQKPF